MLKIHCKKTFQSEAQALSLTEESKSFVTSYEKAQDLQSQSYVEVWKAWATLSTSTLLMQIGTAVLWLSAGCWIDVNSNGL